MKNLSILLLFVLFISCSKKENSAKFIEFNDTKIEIIDDMLSFDSMSEFYEVIQDFYLNEDRYRSLFLLNRPIVNAELAFTDFTKVLDNTSWDSKESIESYIISHGSSVKFDGSEVTALFKMSYKNLFCNLEGQILIGGFIYKYDDIGRFKLKYDAYKKSGNFNSAEYQVLAYSHKEQKIDIRSFVGGSCTDEYDGYRIKCSADVDIDDYGISECFNTLEVIAEAKNRFQRRSLYIWWNSKADYLSIDIEFDVTNSNGNVVLSVLDHRESINAYKTEWGSVNSFCIDCLLTYDFSSYQFDFFGNDDDISYECDLSLNMGGENQNLCAF